MSVLASDYFKDTYSSDEMRSIFCDEGLFGSWLEVEVALAKVQAKLGLIPDSAAIAIKSAARLKNLDISKLKEDYKKIGFPILPVLKQLSEVCDSEVSKYLHWGATTQDIIDTGLVLQMRDGMKIILADLDEIIFSLSELTTKHRNSVMVGRTFQQHAAPITFGYKTAVWLDELLRHRNRIESIFKSSLRCQFGGAVGTIATLGNDGISVLEELSSELGLVTPLISWHTARDNFAEIIFSVSMVVSSLSKIANEVAILMRTEVDELREPFSPGRGGSTTMPQKRNPISCPIIMAIGTRMREFTGTQLAAMIQEHERSVDGQSLEWRIIPDVFLLASGSLRHSKEMLKGLFVNEEQMLLNLEANGGMIMAESVMMGLAPIIGRKEAHELVTIASNVSTLESISLKEALLRQDVVKKHLSLDRLDELLNPLNYTGCASKMIDRVLNKL